jgi:hypothetical protein|tara:strand:+ start:6633 stop:6905 length:273 start_codon:yes stop_codon:yes gene_type:complete
MEKPKNNFIGSVFYNEYEGNFSGYTLYLSKAEVEEAFAKFANAEGRIRLNVRPGRDPQKPYAVITENVSKPYTDNQRADNNKQELNDIPF